MSKTTRAFLCAVLAVGSLLAIGGVAQATILADARADYDAHSPTVGVPSLGLISDSAGDGSWNFYSSTAIDPALGSLTPLNYMASVGTPGTAGYGQQPSFLGLNLPAFANANVIGGEGVTGPNELSIHPGWPIGGDPTPSPYLVMRWTAGPNSAGLIDLDAAFRGAGSSLKDWRVYANGIEQFSETSATTTVAKNGLAIAAGQHVDFVVGGGPGDFYGDHSFFSATISDHGPAVARLRDDYDAHTPVPDAPSTGLIADYSGDGEWNFFGSVTENPADVAAGLTPLIYRTTGPHPVVDGDSYVDPTQTPYFLPGVKNGALLLPASSEGTPDPDELAVHPGQAGRVFNVTRWTAGPNEAGVVNLAGTLRDLGAVHNGVTLSIFARGVQQFGPITTSGNLDIDFDLDVTVAAGSNVDFVVGSNGNFAADHSALSVEIAPVALVPQVVIADVRADYDAHTPQLNEPSSDLISDTQGNGAWDFFASATANPTDAGADLASLIYATTPDSVRAADSYIAAGQFLGLPGVKNGQLILGVNEGVPDDNELGVHPGNTGQARTYQVTRWTAGAGEAGEISVVGSIRNFLAGGNGITFEIYVDGTLAHNGGAVNGSGIPFDFDTTVGVGSVVDFVVGNNVGFGADHSGLAITITQAVPEPSTLALFVLGALGLMATVRRRRV